jgi:PhoPQ-activated pathogenicity-related protein
MNSPQAAVNLISWFRAVTGNTPRPRFYWRADRSTGTLTVRTMDTPTQVTLWQASNPTARDFRLETIGAGWTATPLTGANGIYTAAIPPLAQGWSAYFVELTFPGDLVFTTEVVVTPDGYPFGLPGAVPTARPASRTR